MDRPTLPPNAPVMAQLLADRQGLELWCCRQGCHHHVTVPPAIAVHLVGADVPIGLAHRRFRCSHCGARGREGLVSARPDVRDFYAGRDEDHRRELASWSTRSAEDVVRPPEPA